ncbi:unnamed protein product, partial [Symbiodinium sp. KB8]
MALVQPQTVTGHGELAEPLQVEVRTWGPDTGEGPISHGSVLWVHGETMEISATAGESELHFEVCKADRDEVWPPEGSVHAKVMLDADVSGLRARRSMPLDSSVLPGACLVADISKTRLQAGGSVKKTGLTWHPNVQETRSFQGDRGARRNTPFLPANPPIQEAEERPPQTNQTRRSVQSEDARSSKTDCSNPPQPISMQLDLPETQKISKPRGQAPRNHSVPSPDASQGRASVSKDSQSSGSYEEPRRRSSSQRWRVFQGQEKDSWRDPIRRSKSQPADDLSEKKQHTDAQSHGDLATLTSERQQAPTHMQVDASDSGSLSQYASQDEPVPAELPKARNSARSSDARQSREWRLSAPPQRRTSMVEAASDGSARGGRASVTRSSAFASGGSERASDFSCNGASHVQGSFRLRSSGMQGQVDGTRKPSGHCASDSRGSRLSKRSNRAPSQTYLQRFTCRYTEPRAVTFSGLRQEHPCFADANCAEGLLGRDRTALLVLLEQAEHSVAAVRRQNSLADAATMPRLLASLSAEFVLHAREVRGGHLKTLCEEPVVLVVLQRLIEVLDTLVPVGAGTADAVAFAEPDTCIMGGEAALQHTESVLESLRQAFGPHGFITECMSYLGRKNLEKQLWNEPKLECLVDQMDVLALLAVRIALEWDPPCSVPKPIDVATSTQERFFQTVLERLEHLMEPRGVKPQAAQAQNLAHLALALETLFVMLRSDPGLERLRSVTLKPTHGSDSSRGSDATAWLALLTVDVVQLFLEHAETVPIQSLQLGLPAAVRVLTLLLDAATDLGRILDRFVRILGQILSAATLTTPLLLALVDMVKAPCKPRTWFGSATDAANTRKKLRCSLIRCKMPSQVAVVAKAALLFVLDTLSWLMIEVNDRSWGGLCVHADFGSVLRDGNFTKQLHSVPKAAGAFYDAVEELVYEVHGTCSVLDDEMSDLRSAYEDLDGLELDAGRCSLLSLDCSEQHKGDLVLRQYRPIYSDELLDAPDQEMDISLIRFQHVVKYPVSILASVVEHRR